MVARLWNRGLAQLSILAVALTATGWLASPVAAAGGLDKLDTSLKLIPEDAAFFSSMLRNREQFEAVRKSNAWAKIWEMPVTQMGVALYQAQLGTPTSGPAKLQAALKNPEIRKIVDLVAEMVSDDVFVYGDDSCTDFVKLMQSINRAVQYGPMVLQATGRAGGHNPSQLQAKLAISTLAQHADLIDVPNVVVGFRLKNADLAKEELIKLETMGNIMLESNEQTKGHFKKSKVGKYDYLVLELDGEMIPWDQVPMDRLKALELENGDFEKIIDKLKEAKLVIALGVRENYLLCSIGSSLQCLEKLGQGKRLIDSAELKPLEKFVDKRLTGIGYLSEDMFQQINNRDQTIDELQKLADKLLPAAKLSEQQNARIRKDVAELAKDIKALIPEVGAMMGFGFLSDRGVEHYCYAWGNHDRLDGSKPLGLLQHVGGNPILGLVARKQVHVEDYSMVVKWVKTAYGYFDELALPLMPDPHRQKVQGFLKTALPLVERLDKANREMLIPAMADGQSALVIDGKLTSKHFIKSLPATEKPMPMAEPAIVMGVSDAKLLKQGLGEYRQIVNGLIDAVRHVEGSNVPENIQIPEPQTVEGPLGTIYSFPLPKQWGVDETIVPNLGISSDVLVASISKDHTERLLKSTPLAAGGVLEKTDRPLAVAIWFNLPALVDAGSPWVDFAIERTAAAKGVGEDQQKIIAEQVHTGLEVLKALRSISAESYLEDDVLVCHSLLEIHDVGK